MKTMEEIRSNNECILVDSLEQLKALMPYMRNPEMEVHTLPYKPFTYVYCLGSGFGWSGDPKGREIVKFNSIKE